ncbi:MAG: hypothetical protein R2864_08085 [Syntrophotaleaceae bacterium]
MELDLDLLENLITNRIEDIEERIAAGTGYLPRTVLGVGTFLLDHDGNLDSLTAKQQVTLRNFSSRYWKIPPADRPGKPRTATVGKIRANPMAKTPHIKKPAWLFLGIWSNVPPLQPTARQMQLSKKSSPPNGDGIVRPRRETKAAEVKGSP